MNNCGKHNNNWKGGVNKIISGYLEQYCPNHPRCTKKRPYVRQHILIVEKVLGRFLKLTEQVHHIDSIGLNNKNKNLIVCENQAYHSLIHKRERALQQCGNANWIKCGYCGEWDNKKNLYIRPNGKTGFHRKCQNGYKRRKYENSERRLGDK